MEYPRLILHANKTASLERQHPWIFSGAVQKKEGSPTDGDIVELYNSKGQYLATALYQISGSISARVLSFRQTTIDLEFWVNKIRDAFHLRQYFSICNRDKTNAYRLINAEGDGVPGLIADFYNGTVVIQAHNTGIFRCLADITKALQLVLGDELKSVYNKSGETMPSANNIKEANGFIWGENRTGEVISENGCNFWVDWVNGQKTGFFLDQRENRLQLAEWANNKTVLNAFCYSGGFSVYALRAGAKLVHSVDSSAKAIDWTEKNIALNTAFRGTHQSYVADVMPFLQQAEQSYNLIILDPPAFAKSIKTKHQAVQGYKRLNARALNIIEKGGLLMTFSCSAVIDPPLFFDTIRAAAIESGRKVRVIKRLSSAPDHPVNIYHPEGEYLKGVCMMVD
ncbi:MAG: class I SAM-dependent rRNA methyltransferase [Sphingobacteriales bacterium]|nr:MAG: class I SAM-dependent rRNA methyltransferase [Sphingobacteriales bacterium]